MIYLLITGAGVNPFYFFLNDWAPSLQGTLRAVTYENLMREPRAPAATYIFSDLERLTPREVRAAVQLYEQLSEAGDRVRLLNDPSRVLRRYDLLRALHEAGHNDFDVFRVTDERRPKRFPVFIREELEHTGSLTKLLHNQRAVDRALLALRLLGKRPEDLLIVEFCDCSDTDGRFRRFGTHVIGERTIPGNFGIDDHWEVKTTPNPPPVLREQLERFTSSVPHPHVLEAFRLAAIEYGRMDHCEKEGRIQVWEINTNPLLSWRRTPATPAYEMIRQRRFELLREAFEAIDQPLDGTIPIAVDATAVFAPDRRTRRAKFLSRTARLPATAPFLRGGRRLASRVAGVTLKRPEAGPPGSGSGP